MEFFGQAMLFVSCALFGGLVGEAASKVLGGFELFSGFSINGGAIGVIWGIAISVYLLGINNKLELIVSRQDRENK